MQAEETIAPSDGTAAPRGAICLAAGTLVTTPQGLRPVEALSVGDRVLTADSGARPIRWIGRQRVAARGALAPVRLEAGVLGASRPLLVSPQHRLLVGGARVQLITGEAQGLTAALHLVDGRGITRAEGGEVTYVHLMFDRHEVIWAEGVQTESFFVGETGLALMPAAMRAEFAALFPELAAAPARFGLMARPELSAREARLVPLA